MRTRTNPPRQFDMKKWRKMGCPLTDVFCDGVLVPRATSYDMNAGWVEHQVIDENGRPKLDDKKKEILLTRRRGVITAKFRHNVAHG